MPKSKSRKSKKGKSTGTEKKGEQTKEQNRMAIMEPMMWHPQEIMRRLDREFEDFRRNFERSFWWPKWWNEVGLESGFSLAGRPGMRLATTRTPLMDIKDTGSELVIKAEMPGVPKENIDVHLTETSIEICGEIRTEEKEDGEDYLRRERRYSTCFRQVPLPAEVLPDEADATMEEGILRVVVPKKKTEPMAREKARRVKIR